MKRFFLQKGDENIYLKRVHLLILFFGTLFLLSGALHSWLWFDESYTVGLINHDLISLCKIAAYDVHPFWYYIILKLYSYIFGDSIIALRIFSVLGASVLACLGYFHISKDFGRKTGIYFSAFIFLMPSTFKYALQIRMYTWAPVFVTLTAIYAYRMKADMSKKNGLLFMLFSLMAAYTHYYGVAAVAIINLLLLGHFIYHKKGIGKWLCMAAVQLGLYLPGFYVLFIQLKTGGGDWMVVKYPAIIWDTISFHFLGLSRHDIGVDALAYHIALAAGAIFYLFLVFLLWKLRKKEIKPAILALVIYFVVIFLFLVVSEYRVAYFVRYTMISYALLIFALAFLAARDNSVWIKKVIIILMLAVSVIRAIPIYQENYNTSNKQIDTFFKENLKEGDIIVFNDYGDFPISVKYQKNKTYFYNEWNWNVDQTYKAFGENVIITNNLDSLKDFRGRMWVIDKSDAYKKIISNPESRQIEEQSFSYPYCKKQKQVDIVLIEQ